MKIIDRLFIRPRPVWFD